MTPDEQARTLAQRALQEIYANYQDTIVVTEELFSREIGIIAKALLTFSRPTWTDARPTEPGWYAWRDQASSPFVIWVGQETIERNKRGELSTWGDGQWARIAMPEDQP